MENEKNGHLPNRAEIRQILKTGKGLDGKTIHPDDVESLKPARLYHLKQFGGEVNKATENLKRYIDDIELMRNFTFTVFLGFLFEKKIIDSKEYMEYCEKAQEEFKHSAEEAIKKVQTPVETPASTAPVAEEKPSDSGANI